MPEQAERFRCVVAVHLFLLQGEQVLLLQRANTGYADGQYSVIAGHLDGDETVLAATCREAWEEAGIRLAEADLAVVGVMQRRAVDPGDAERIDFFLTARRWAGMAHNAEPAKCAELRWSSLTALPPNVVPYVRQALSNYQQGIVFSTLGW